MNYANQVGLFNVAQMMKKFQQNPLDDAKFWEPAPLIKSSSPKANRSSKARQ